MPVFQSDFAMHSSKRWGEVIRKSETLGWGEERRAEWHNIWRTEWVLVTWSGLRSDVVTECFLRGLDGSQSVLRSDQCSVRRLRAACGHHLGPSHENLLLISAKENPRWPRPPLSARRRKNREESTSRDRGSMLRRTRGFSAWWRTRGRGKLCTN